MKTLFDAEVDKNYKIVGVIRPEDSVSRRLLEMGFTSGQVAKVIAKSLQKKAFLVEIRGYVLSVRAELLKMLQVRL